MSNILHYLSFDNYIEYLYPAGDGCMGTNTHVAKVIWSDGVQRDSYVKFYDEKKPRGLLNEAIGYLIIESLKLPQPKYAGFLEFHISEQTTSPEFWQKIPHIDKLRGKTIAWVTSDTGGINRKLQIEEEADNDTKAYLQEQLIESLKKWKHLSDLIVLDDWLANGDRNLGNILELPDRSFSLIDHGNILFGNNWSVWDLSKNLFFIDPSKKFYCNVLGSNISEPLFWFQSLVEILKEAKQKHQPSFQNIHHELVEILDDFLGNECFEIDDKSNKYLKVADILYSYLEENSKKNDNIEHKCAAWVS